MYQEFLNPKPAHEFEGEEYYEYNERYSITKTGKVYDNRNHKLVAVTGSHANNKRHSYYVCFMTLPNGKQTRVRIHRMLAKLFIANPEDKQLVDHIDQNTLNNDLTNLRWVTARENGQNLKQKKGRFIGVSKMGNKYRASIKFYNENIHLGTFDTPELAAIAYNKRAEELGYLTRNNVDEFNF